MPVPSAAGSPTAGAPPADSGLEFTLARFRYLDGVFAERFGYDRDDPPVRAALRAARQVSEWTGGKFDVTFGALSGLWKFDHDQDNRVLGPDFRWMPTGSDTITGQFLVSRSQTPNRPDLASEEGGLWAMMDREGVEGLSLLLRTIERVRVSFNPVLQMHGVVLTMFDRRNNLSEQVVADVRAHMGEAVYETIIPRNVRLAEAPSYGLPGVVFDPSARGSVAFVDFAQEMVERLKG